MKETKVLLNGELVDFEECVMRMDDDLREEIHEDMAPCGEQEFLDEYIRRHAEKFGEEFTI